MGLARPVQIAFDRGYLQGDLAVPDGSRALVVFVHGSGSSRFSHRNRGVADHLNRNDLGTLLMDLLTPDEERVDERGGRFRFDIPLLAERVTAAVDWLQAEHEPAPGGIGLFGASTGAAAALVTAAERPDLIGAVVSRGGRPDLADDALEHVRAPTLLVVGGRDEYVLDLNRHAASRLRGEQRLEVVPGATHLFEEPGALDQVAHLAAGWFTHHLAGAATSEARR